MATSFDVVIIGAGAAGMMCAAEAGRRGRRVLVVDHAEAPGEKIRISGGGRCNFTNLGTTPANFLSENRHFCKSALARYTPRDFVALVERHGIGWHEKTLGQLFCNDSARDIVRMLLDEMQSAGVVLRLGTTVAGIEAAADGFRVLTGDGAIGTRALVMATGGRSIPKMGATGFAYRIAEQFGLPVVETRPSLVPLTVAETSKERLAALAGLAVDVRATCGKTAFEEAMLFTHRGLSGPAILQISSYWREGAEIRIAFEPGCDSAAAVKAARRSQGKQAVQTVLAELLPRRLAHHLATEAGLADRPVADLSDRTIDELAAFIGDWSLKPAGSEGYRTAEVTLGGVDTRHLDQKTMMAKTVPGLYFIGECVDVTGWLGGYNFQWAWASGFSCGQAI